MYIEEIKKELELLKSEFKLRFNREVTEEEVSFLMFILEAKYRTVEKLLNEQDVAIKKEVYPAFRDTFNLIKEVKTIEELQQVFKEIEEFENELKEQYPQYKELLQEKEPELEQFTCEHHTRTGGYESCCDCSEGRKCDEYYKHH